MVNQIPYKHKSVFASKIKDIDAKKGIVSIYVNGFNNLDSDGDISSPNSFTKTIKENFSRIKHLLNHSTSLLLGCPLEFQPDSYGLKVVSQLNLQKQLAKDVFSDYEFFAEKDRSLEHSIGYEVIKRDQKDKRIITEYKLWEYSTLNGWGANENTPLVDMKNLLSERINYKGSDDYMKKCNETLIKIKAMLNKESNMVTCPTCGMTFDYNSMKEFNIEDYVLRLLIMYIRWATDDVVREFVNGLKPELQTLVQNIINNENITEIMNVEMTSEEKAIDVMDTENKIKSLKSITTKAISMLSIDIMKYVDCPKCGSPVQRNKSLKNIDPLKNSHEFKPIELVKSLNFKINN